LYLGDYIRPRPAQRSSSRISTQLGGLVGLSSETRDRAMNRPNYSVSIPAIERKTKPDGAEPWVRHLDQRDLGRRWRMSVRTLERWRWSRKGPKFIKVGGRVLYRLADIESFEAANLRLRDEG
jgi:hypothetical protein